MKTLTIVTACLLVTVAVASASLGRLMFDPTPVEQWADVVYSTMSPLRRTVITFYATSSTAAQNAIAVDVCGDLDEMVDSSAEGDKLSADDKKVYDDISDKLLLAYRATSGTDGEVEQVRRDFCDAMFYQD